MPSTEPSGTPTSAKPMPAYGSERMPAYGGDAGRYDVRTAGYEVYRRRVLGRLPLSAGGTSSWTSAAVPACASRG
jgi:hypothetical protein